MKQSFQSNTAQRRASHAAVAGLAAMLAFGAVSAAQEIDVPTAPLDDERRERLEDAVRELDERRRAAEADAEAAAEAERMRPKRYNYSCRVTQIIASSNNLRISCDQLRNRRFASGPREGEIYAPDETNRRDTTVYLRLDEDPAFAATAVAVASAAYEIDTRIMVEAVMTPPSRNHVLELIMISKVSGY